jgi:RNA polymerase sigma-70 factor (ECF subfamily)
MPGQDSQQLDEVLVVASILGDLGAFEELVGRYRAAVVRTAQAIVGREDAEDVAQDSLLIAFKALPSIDDPSKFAAWLSAITRHRAMRIGKRERVHGTGRIGMDDLLIERIASLQRPFVDKTEDDDEIRIALEHIPADYALALKLRFIDDMPLKRIAGFLALPVSTVKWRVHRGKKLMREEIERIRSVPFTVRGLS